MQGLFVWVKFAFDKLGTKDGLWSPSEMQQALPEGLHGVFRHVLGLVEVRRQCLSCYKNKA